ncbi:MAG: Bacterial polymerase, alpha chain terminal domain [Bacteroidota bacterium]|jgi:hypothetical protein
MELQEREIEMIHIPSKDEMKLMNNYELFNIANQYEGFRRVMISFISSFEVKPIVFIPDVEGKYNVRKIGLPERIKNILLQNDFEYLSDLTFVNSEDLLKMKNFGSKSYKMLLDILDIYGFELADHKKNQPNE